MGSAGVRARAGGRAGRRRHPGGGWRGIFWFNLAFGLAGLVVAAVVLAEDAARRRRVDTADPAGRSGARRVHVRDHELGVSRLRSAQVISLLCVSAVLLVGVHLAGAPRSVPSGPPVLAGASVRHVEHRRVLQLLLDVRHLLLRRAVPRPGRRGVRLPARAGVLADDGADDRLLAAGRGIGQLGRAALVDHDQLPAVRRRAVPGATAACPPPHPRYAR